MPDQYQIVNGYYDELQTVPKKNARGEIIPTDIVIPHGPGEIVESEFPLDREFQNKFRRLHQDRPAVTNPYAWDPKKETLEEFNKRMQLLQSTTPQPPPAATENLPPPKPKVEEKLNPQPSHKGK